MRQPRSGTHERPKVVVVGGGFAGLAAVRQLSVADVDVLLLDRNGYTTFQPLLYQVATGGPEPWRRHLSRCAPSPAGTATPGSAGPR